MMSLGARGLLCRVGSLRTAPLVQPSIATAAALFPQARFFSSQGKDPVQEKDHLQSQIDDRRAQMLVAFSRAAPDLGDRPVPQDPQEVCRCHRGSRGFRQTRESFLQKDFLGKSPVASLCAGVEWYVYFPLSSLPSDQQTKFFEVVQSEIENQRETAGPPSPARERERTNVPFST
eukprot:Skav207735  [mRNA]  locus=scaffold362:340560:341084:- [translate_table: standard]